MPDLWTSEQICLLRDSDQVIWSETKWWFILILWGCYKDLLTRFGWSQSTVPPLYLCFGPGIQGPTTRAYNLKMAIYSKWALWKLRALQQWPQCSDESKFSNGEAYACRHSLLFAGLNGVSLTDRSLFWASVVLCYCSRAHGIRFPVRGGQAAASSSNQSDGHPLGPEL